MSQIASSSLQTVEDEYGLHINEKASAVDFERALEEVGRQKAKRSANDSISWQRHGMSDFAESQRWIFGGKVQKLWPYGGRAGPNSTTFILYPDLFLDLGFEVEKEAELEAQRVPTSPRWKAWESFQRRD